MRPDSLSPLDFRAFFVALYLHGRTLFGTFITIPLGMNDIERQMRLEADGVRDSLLRRAKSREYQLATDFKPAKDLVANCPDFFKVDTEIVNWLES